MSNTSKQNRKSVPAFTSEAEEQKFWETQDSADLIDWSKAKSVTFSKLRPTTEAISLRLPKNLLDAVRVEANKRDVPYQSLIKMMLAASLNQIRGKQA